MSKLSNNEKKEKNESGNFAADFSTFIVRAFGYAFLTEREIWRHYTMTYVKKINKILSTFIIDTLRLPFYSFHSTFV